MTDDSQIKINIPVSSFADLERKVFDTMQWFQDHRMIGHCRYDVEDITSDNIKFIVWVDQTHANEAMLFKLSCL